MYADFAQRHNKLHQTIKSLTISVKAKEQRICDLEEKISSLEAISKSEIDTKLDQIMKRLVNVENTTAKNQERIKCSEAIEKELKTPSEKNKKELEIVTEKMQRDNESFKKTIDDLDKKLSNLDSEYQSIKGVIELKKSHSEETSNKINQIQTDFFSMQKKLEARHATKRFDHVDKKCRNCDYSSSNKQELKCHVETLHSQNKCNQCEEKFPSSWQLENHLQDHGSQKKHICKDCGKTFHLSWRLNKHIKMHGSERTVRMCHFYNNGKPCPFEEIGCKFLHKESSKCKYLEKCRYDKCQFRH